MSPASAKKHTILIVDDEPSILKMAGRVLLRHGYDVLLASDGLEALEIFSKHRDAIGAVLLDMTMPRMDGRATYDALIEIAPDVRVLFSSGYARTEAGIESKNVGYIDKPYGAQELVDRLRALL